jgi:hypothetical protein
MVQRGESFPSQPLSLLLFPCARFTSVSPFPACLLSFPHSAVFTAHCSGALALVWLGEATDNTVVTLQSSKMDVLCYSLMRARCLAIMDFLEPDEDCKLFGVK